MSTPVDSTKAAAGGAHMLALEVTTGEGRGRFELRPGDPPLTIGRKEGENLLAIRDEQGTVSRRHAVIEAVEDGYRVRDLGSRNGVHLHGRPVGTDGARLEDGDEIHLGLAVVRVRVRPMAAPTPPPTVADEERTMVEKGAPVRAPAPAAAPVRPAAPAPPAPAAPRPPSRQVQARPELPVIDRVGPFEILRELYASATLSLQYATDTRRDARVLLRRWRGGGLGFFARGRFRKAYDAAAALRHEALLAPVEANAKDEPFVVYPGVDGVTAGMVTRAAGRDLGIEVAVYVAREVCRAVEAVTKALGPGRRVHATDHDVLVGRDGAVHLLYVADPGGLPVDERYTAPEEDAGGSGDVRATVFSIGILLYELLAREPIAAGQKLTLPSVDVRRIQVGPELAEIVMRAIEVRPESRFAHSGDLARSLSGILEELAPGFGPERLGTWVASRFPE